MELAIPLSHRILEVEQFISQSSARGLALLIGCQDPKKSLLPGVEKDLDLLIKTFSKIRFEIRNPAGFEDEGINIAGGFDTIEMRDPDSEVIVAVVQTIAKHFRGRYKCLVVTFSGHGDETHLFSKSKPFQLSDVMQPLISIDPLVSKLFFVDACRGRQKDIGVDVSSEMIAEMNARGPDIRLPSNGNYLLAHSTLYGTKSFDNNSGSYWMKILCDELSSGSKTSIHDKLTIVNYKFIKKCNEKLKIMQQPIFTSCLNLDIYFHPTGEYSGTGTTNHLCLGSATDTGMSGAQLIKIPVKLPSETHSGRYRAALNYFKQKGIIEEGGEIESRKKNNNEQLYKCTIKAKLINKRHVTAESEYRPKKLAEEEASEKLCLQIQSYLKEPADQLALPLPTAQPVPLPAPQPVPLPAPQPVPLPAPLPAAQLAPLPAAQLAPLPAAQLAPLPAAQRAPLPAAQPKTLGGKSPTAKTSKSRLKEYCDKNWKGSDIIYSSEHTGGDFIATVTLPDKVTCLTGPAKLNKKEAENSAAELMLGKLGI